MNSKTPIVDANANSWVSAALREKAEAEHERDMARDEFREARKTSYLERAEQAELALRNTAAYKFDQNLQVALTAKAEAEERIKYYEAEHKEIEALHIACEQAELALATAKQELVEEAGTRDRMRDILTRTANELKGHPEGTYEHDWSDLQARVYTLKQRAMQAELALQAFQQAVLETNGTLWTSIQLRAAVIIEEARSSAATQGAVIGKQHGRNSADEPASAAALLAWCDALYPSPVPRRTIWGMEETEFGDGVREAQCLIAEALRTLLAQQVLTEQIAAAQPESAAPASVPPLDSGSAATDTKHGAADPITHNETDECGFDRNASISADHYVCTCGWEDNTDPLAQEPVAWTVRNKLTGAFWATVQEPNITFRKNEYEVMPLYSAPSGERGSRRAGEPDCLRCELDLSCVYGIYRWSTADA